MIIYRILLLTLLIMVVYSTLIYVLYNESEEQTKEEQQEKKEEKEKAYLTLQNMTTQEILLFKNKNEFIKDVGCYDILRNFYNDDEIIKKIYPNYKRLD